MNTKLFAWIIVSLVIGAGAGYVVAAAQVSILQSEKTELEQKIEELQADYASLNSSNHALQATYAQTQSLYTVLQADWAALNISYQNLQEAYEDLLQTGGSTVKGIYFSPDGGCEDAVLSWISRANVSIHVLIYSFTLDSVGDALLDAYGRDVEVQMVFDKGQISQYSEYRRLADAGLAVRNDTNSAYMHNKVMIVDGTVVLTGSFNWSANAQENNDENLIVLEGDDVADAYEAVFQQIWSQSHG